MLIFDPRRREIPRDTKDVVAWMSSHKNDERNDVNNPFHDQQVQFDEVIANKSIPRKRSSNAQTKAKIAASVTDLTKADDDLGDYTLDSRYAHRGKSRDSNTSSSRRNQNIVPNDVVNKQQQLDSSAQHEQMKQMDMFMNKMEKLLENVMDSRAVPSDYNPQSNNPRDVSLNTSTRGRKRSANNNENDHEAKREVAGKE